MKVALCIIGAIAFGFIARWAQKRIGKSEVVFRDANGNIESRTESDNLKK